MDLDDAAIQQLKSSGLGVIRIFGLDEEQSLAFGFVVVVLFSIFMLLTAPKPNIRRPSAKPADKPATGTSDKKVS
eukprot:CAMPEP_0184368680 /NCGR_PEP_ID=MMETSP1089-20130417/161808_1 /TAXON_ID=38269 ORGANISM="Gloeochaete wittrockiana, Strain SAG46.84" /NCGR_SAMPLE_ID=MMETSP1089 /ASSEMBLY_ACC=CAM_ASM_000445 /LENGTH=74 /DNA_ID=CAMNT_0026711013 /DNA_START=88 /DNA_END=312 /DNA_ORIENTATION=+